MEEQVRGRIERMEKLEMLLSDPAVIADQKRYRTLAQEHAHLAEIQELWRQCQSLQQQIQEREVLLKKETDPEWISLFTEELPQLGRELAVLRGRMEELLVPADPQDSRNTIVELRAGTGGDEAALFVGDCVRMYRNYADVMGWAYELLSSTPSELGGFKEYIMVLSGKDVHRRMQYEAGTHRVQRVPATETQGRVHTSAITVAVLLEPNEEERIEIDEQELKIDTYRASGAGGQHVNTTDSAVRITHLPTGTVVYSQEERSQHKNKANAMRLLVAKIQEERARKSSEERASLRAFQVGSGDRSERIRTYNFAQNRVTDHRIDLTLYKLDRVIAGDLSELTEALIKHFHQEKLASAIRQTP